MEGTVSIPSWVFLLALGTFAFLYLFAGWQWFKLLFVTHNGTMQAAKADMLAGGRGFRFLIYIVVSIWPLLFIGTWIYVKLTPGGGQGSASSMPPDLGKQC